MSCIRPGRRLSAGLLSGHDLLPVLQVAQRWIWRRKRVAMSALLVASCVANIFVLRAPTSKALQTRLWQKEHSSKPFDPPKRSFKPSFKPFFQWGRNKKYAEDKNQLCGGFMSVLCVLLHRLLKSRQNYNGQ
eukprot:jgi/Bigna1/132878/aug1.19_g7586